MAFLFKSKKSQEKAAAATKAENSHSIANSQSSLQGAGPNAGRGSKEHKDGNQTPTPTSSVNNSINSFHGKAPSPEPQPGAVRRVPTLEQQSDLPLRNAIAPPVQSLIPASNATLYPWSYRKLTYTSSHPSPFPRYGAAVNSVASKDGDIYMMGGLINSATVKGDLWLVEAGGANLACYPLATTAEGPGPRVGHASLLVGNAFIVYGGDTKMDDSDVLDETLYLLNTSTRQWSRAVPAGPRPSGRYGHSLNILGSKIYVFGGQVEGYFMNDLVAFDLNQLQVPSNRWEMLIQNDELAAGGNIPPPRTNHSVVTYNEQLYLFGGTNGFQWFNDVWCYDPVTNSWSNLDCIGYIPAPREGHAAALVDDVMYIFGGRTEEGADLGDLAAFRISTRRWYTFQNMGPSPSPRSGHSMTAYGKQVVVLGGEPSTASRDANDLSVVFLLDTTKIRYPNDQMIQQTPAGEQVPGRRPSDPDKRIGAPRNLTSRDGSTGPPDPRRLNGAPPRASIMGSQNMYGGRPNGPPGVNGNDMNGIAPGSAQPQGPGPGSKLPRASLMQAPAGPPPQGQAPNRPNGIPQPTNGNRGKPPGQRFGPAVDTSIRSQSMERDGQVSPRGSPVMNGRRTPTSTQKSPIRDEVNEGPPPVEHVNMPPIGPARSSSGSRSRRPKESLDSINEGVLKSVTNRGGSPPPPSRQGSGNSTNKPKSARNSQTVNLLNELDNLRNKNVWMASELELARKSGYTPGGIPSSVMDNRVSTSFSESEKPLIEALIAMRNELGNVQASIDKQAVMAAKKIAEVESQRDAAINEAVYAKAKLAAHGGSQTTSPQIDESRDMGSRAGERSADISRKLAASLGVQGELQMQIDRLRHEVEAERRSRQLAEDTTKVAEARISELESYKQQNSTEAETLRAELHHVQKEAREQAAQCAEAVAKAQLLEIEKESLESRHKELTETSRDNSDTFESLREALASSHGMKELLERKLEEQSGQREIAEEKLRKLRTEHEERTSELEMAHQKLQDAEEMAEKHASEAHNLRQVVLSGLDRASSRANTMSPTTSNEKLLSLQQQIETANSLVRKYQTAADAASEKLRSAEERIAGLEAYQEQVSREGMSIRKQLQSSMREVQTLQAANSEMRTQNVNHEREAKALHVQHNTLKDLLQERGISPASAGRARNLNSPLFRSDTPEQNRVREVEQKSRELEHQHRELEEQHRELEQQLLTAQQAHEETKQLQASEAQEYAAQKEEAEVGFRAKLSQLETDYQSAVHYVKGTEKMLKRMKDDLNKYKAENTQLKAEVNDVRAKSEAAEAAVKDGANAPSDWEEERDALRYQISNLQSEIEISRSELEKQLADVQHELETSRHERDSIAANHEQIQRQLSDSFEQARGDLEQLQQENSLLEQRALDAEQKVSLLLDQVETSVDNYRRQSHVVNDATTGNKGHVRNLSGIESISGESMYSDTTERAGDRSSMALDSLASELETLRTHWETTSKNYRQSTNFDFDKTPVLEKTEEQSLGGGDKSDLSNSLADWRKRLDSEEQQSRSRKASADQGVVSISPVGAAQQNLI